MKKRISLVIIMAFLNISFAQEIEMKTNLLGYKFAQNGEKLNWNGLVKATQSNTEANLLIKKAKSQHTISTIAALLGGGLTGIPIGQSISDREANWTLAYIGGGIIAIGIPLSLSAFKNVTKGVDKYNLSLKSTSSIDFKPEFKIIANGNGIGLSINF